MKIFLKIINKAFFVIMVLMAFVNCENESVDLNNQDTSVRNAKAWFVENKQSLRVLEYAKTIDWKKAIVTDGVKGKVVEVPIFLKEKDLVNINYDKSLKCYNRLMFILDEKKVYNVYHVIISHKNDTFDVDDEEVNFYKIKEDFEGLITVIDSKNTINDVVNLGNKKTNRYLITNKTNTDGVVCVYYGYWDENDEFHAYYQVGCYGGGSGSSGGTSYGGGGGKGDSDPTIGNNLITLLGPEVKIADIMSYLKCINLNQSAELIIYIDQPIANSADSYSISSSGYPNVGHSFIAIQQGGVRRVFGYYPATTVDPSAPNDPRAFGNNEGHVFDVSISIPISATRLVDIIGYVANAPLTYDLNNYNCTDFVIGIGNLGGLNLPDSYGTWPYGGGSNPGQLGQYIRGMVLPANAYRQTTISNAAANKGTCN